MGYRPVRQIDGVTHLGREEPSGGEFRGKNAPERRESGGFRAQEGGSLGGPSRGREPWPKVAKSCGKVRKNGRRRELTLSASGGNWWFGRLAADRKAPRA